MTPSKALRRARWLRVGAPMKLAPVMAWDFIEPWIWGRFDLDALASMQLDGQPAHWPKAHPRRPR